MKRFKFDFKDLKSLLKVPKFKFKMPKMKGFKAKGPKNFKLKSGIRGRRGAISHGRRPPPRPMGRRPPPPRPM